MIFLYATFMVTPLGIYSPIFHVATIKLWNSLPYSILSCNSINIPLNILLLHNLLDYSWCICNY